jgi:hypothetical protein
LLATLPFPLTLPGTQSLILVHFVLFYIRSPVSHRV